MADSSQDESDPGPPAEIPDESKPRLPVEISRNSAGEPQTAERPHMASGEYSSALHSFEAANTSAEISGRYSPGYLQTSMESPSFRKRPPAGGISSNFIKAKQVDEESIHSSFGGKVRAAFLRMLSSTRFANIMALVVLVDASSLIVDIDSRAAGKDPPGLLMLMSDLCLAMYTAELALQIILRGWRILFDALVMVDAIIIACGYAELLMNTVLTSEMRANISFFSMLRVLRLARIMRLVRLLRKAPRLRELQKLVTMMATCMKTLAWSFVFCFVIMTIWAMLLVEIVGPLIRQLMEDEDRGKELRDRCGEECELLTSSVMYANVLLFKTVIAGDSWGLIAVPVIKEYPATAIIFMGSLLTLVFGVLNLIVAVVVDTFAEARERDVLNLAEEMERNHENDKKFLQKVFDRIDEDGSGQLSLEELIEGARKDPEFQSRLRVMDIDEVDLEQLFDMIDVDGSGEIEAAEFIAPLSRWVHESKTAPRFIKYNMLRTMQQQEEIYRQSEIQFQVLKAQLAELGNAIHTMSQGRPQLSPLGSPNATPGAGAAQGEDPQDPELTGTRANHRHSLMSAGTEPLESLERECSITRLPDIAEELEQPQASVQADLRKQSLSRKPPQPLSSGAPNSNAGTDSGPGPSHSHSPTSSDTALKSALESLEHSLLIATEGALKRSMNYVELALQQRLGQLTAGSAFSSMVPAKYPGRRRSVFGEHSRKGSFDHAGNPMGNPFLMGGIKPGEFSRLGSFDLKPSRLGSFEMKGADDEHSWKLPAAENGKRPGIPAKAIRNTASSTTPDSPGVDGEEVQAARSRATTDLVQPTSRKKARHSVADYHFGMNQVTASQGSRHTRH